MIDKMTALLATLARTTTFDEAATATLRAMLAVADEARCGSPFAAQGRLLRAMAHLRPADGYRRLTVVENAPDDEPGSTPGPAAGEDFAGVTAVAEGAVDGEVADRQRARRVEHRPPVATAHRPQPRYRRLDVDRFW